MDLMKLLKLNMQFFSQDDTGGTNPEGDDSDNTEDDTPPTDKSFTQSEVDSKISKAVQTALDNREKEIEQRIADERKEAERLAKLSEKEREKEKLTQREKDLEKRAAELERKELLADAESILRDKGLATSFANILLGEDAAKTLDNINNFKTAFDEAVNAQVKEKLRQDTPPAGGGQIKTNKGYNIAEMAKNARIIK